MSAGMTNEIGHKNSNNVKVLRMKRDILQKDLASAVGIKRSYVAMIEKGNTPSLEVAYRIAKYFGKTIDDVFYNKHDDT